MSSRQLVFVAIALVLACAAVHALPVKLASPDLGVLKFASLLEQLESTFYLQALAKFQAYDFQAAGFVSSEVVLQQIEIIASDEIVHSVTLESLIIALGGQVTSGCIFDFSAALTDVSIMVETARVLEIVGVAAYLGALTAISNPSLVTAAGSIMTVEARHQSILNILSGQTSIPQPFDMALQPAEVLALAGGFISGCDLDFPANPPLAVTNSGCLQSGTKLEFSSPALNGTIPENELSCQIFVGGANASISQPICGCAVPANITGPMFVFITDNKRPMMAQSNMTSRSVVAGPALVFIDNMSDGIGALVRPGSNGVSGNATSPMTQPTASPSITPPMTMTLAAGTSMSVTPSPAVGTSSGIISMDSFTTTISPGEASAILASALPTDA